jgi:hypothetical protein
MSAPATLERSDSKDTSGNATTAAPANAPDAAAGCPKCGNLDSWGTASWCPQCGYYPRLGTCVSETNSAGDKEARPAPSTYLEALARVPQWAYVLAAGVIAIFVVSVAVRALTPDDSLFRDLWSHLQLFIGGMTFIVVHCYAFIRGGAKGSRLGGFDVVIHPIEVWRPSFQELPQTARRIWVGAWGFTAAICAMMVIGGIRYSALTDDWGFKQRAQKNLLKQIKDKMLSNAKEEDGGKSLEDSINDFAGDDEAMKNKKKNGKKKNADLELLSAECVVIGYNVDKQNGEIRELVLATLVGDKLQYAGLITGGIPPNVQQQLQLKLSALEQERPFVNCPRTAQWVKPVVTCRTAFKSWSEKKLMEQPVFKELLADIEMK